MNFKDFSKYTNTEYNDFMLNREHPMCRCMTIIGDIDKNYCPYINVSKEIVNDKRECKFIWDDYIEN